MSVNNNLRTTGSTSAAPAARQARPRAARDHRQADIEYDSTTYRDLVLATTAPMNLLTYTGGALSTGVETLQVIVPEIKFDGELPKANGTDLIVPGRLHRARQPHRGPADLGRPRTADTAL
jgi:hypothetical protein